MCKQLKAGGASSQGAYTTPMLVTASARRPFLAPGSLPPPTNPLQVISTNTAEVEAKATAATAKEAALLVESDQIAIEKAEAELVGAAAMRVVCVCV